jgi:hypothetical protein
MICEIYPWSNLRMIQRLVDGLGFGKYVGVIGMLEMEKDNICNYSNLIY